jgi:hypothetical protein
MAVRIARAVAAGIVWPLLVTAAALIAGREGVAWAKRTANEQYQREAEREA